MREAYFKTFSFQTLTNLCKASLYITSGLNKYLKLKININRSKYLPMSPKVSGKNSVKMITMAE